MLRRFNFIFLAICLALAFPMAAAADEPLWIDVRTANEYSEVHVEQAINIPHTEITEGITEFIADKDALIYVYCRSGHRSGIAKETLESLGYTQVVNIGGLQDALKKSGQYTGD